jgi:hypothetical protein
MAALTRLTRTIRFISYRAIARSLSPASRRAGSATILMLIVTRSSVRVCADEVRDAAEDLEGGE